MIKKKKGKEKRESEKSEEREGNKSENGKRQSKRKDGMRVGKSRSGGREKRCGNCHFLSCRLPTLCHCLPAFCVQFVRPSGVRKGAGFHGGGWHSCSGLIRQYCSPVAVTALTDQNLMVMVQHYISLLDSSL